MIDYDMTIDSAAIKSMTSARADSIYLPYANSGDICYHAGQMIADHIGQTGKYPDSSDGDKQFSDDHTRIFGRSTITAYLALQPSRVQPRAGFVIDIDTSDGQRLHGQIYAPDGDKIAAEIISKFLVAGAPGLRDDIRQCYERQHRAFLERQQRKPGAA